MEKIVIDSERIRQGADMGFITLSATEEQEAAVFVDAVLREVEKMDACDLSDVPFTSNVLEFGLVMRPDQPMAVCDRETLLSLAPSRDEMAYVVPRVLE